MNLTIEQLSKATKLSVSTIRLYASQRNLGKKVRNRRVFSQADVQALLKGSRKSSSKKAPKVSPKRTIKRVAKPEPVVATKPKTTNTLTSPVAAKPLKPSFWSRVFGGGRKRKKISLMEATTTK